MSLFELLHLVPAVVTGFTQYDDDGYPIEDEDWDDEDEEETYDDDFDSDDEEDEEEFE